MNSIRQRAKLENMKSNEIVYINGKNIEQKKMNLEQKIEETRERRSSLLESVKSKQLDRSDREVAAERRRQALVTEREHKRMTKLQKLEEAELRRLKILEDKKARAEELSKRRAERSLVATPRQEKTVEEESCSSNEEIPSLLAYKEWGPSDASVKVTFSKKRRRIQKQRVEGESMLWCSVCNEVLLEATEQHVPSEKHRNELTREII